MKKVMIIGPCLKMGGMERASSNLANAFSKMGLEVVYVSIFKQEHFFKLDPPVRLDEPLDGSNVHSLSIVKTIVRIRKALGIYRPDRIIAFGKFYAAMSCLATMGSGIPIYISERSSPLFNWAKKIQIFNRISFWLKPPNGVIAQTRIAAQYQRKYYGNAIPIKVIHNVTRNIQLFNEVTRRDFILAVGRLNDPLKGFDRLILALSKVKCSWPLVIAGGQGDDEELTRLITSLNLEGRVDFMGKVDEMDIVYAEAGLFVIPSRSEGFPNALSEAMCAGLPCISFNFVAGPSELIENGVNGVLVEDGNIAELASAIDNLAGDKKMRDKLGLNALATRKKLNEEFISKQVLEFIKIDNV